MSEDQQETDKAKPKTQAEHREARLRAQLRNNLQRRKQKARALKSTPKKDNVEKNED